jgi:hypothetical protein
LLGRTEPGRCARVVRRRDTAGSLLADRRPCHARHSTRRSCHEPCHAGSKCHHLVRMPAVPDSAPGGGRTLNPRIKRVQDYDHCGLYQRLCPHRVLPHQPTSVGGRCRIFLSRSIKARLRRVSPKHWGLSVWNKTVYDNDLHLSCNPTCHRSRRQRHPGQLTGRHRFADVEPRRGGLGATLRTFTPSRVARPTR